MDQSGWVVNVELTYILHVNKSAYKYNTHEKKKCIVSIVFVQKTLLRLQYEQASLAADETAGRLMEKGLGPWAFLF